MKFNPSPLKDAFTIELNKLGDDRGFFARFFCQDEYAEHDLFTDIKQINTSLTAQKGTLRGMHYQLPGSAEIKVVRCIKGSLFDVILDLRPDSPTYGQWYGEILSAENRLMMYAPRGFAHGFLTLEDDTEAFYLTSTTYDPDKERGIRYNDPKFDIKWPNEVIEVSDKDKSWPDFEPEWHGIDLMKGIK